MARTYNGPIYDGDGHVLENKDGIIDRMPRDLQASRAVERMRRRNVFPELDNYHNLLSISPEGSFSNPEEVRGWTRFMDELSIGSAVLYPTEALAVGRMVDLDQIEMATMAYNDWIHQEYLQKDDRLQALALLPMQEPELAAAELRRAVEELGMCGGMLPATGLQGHLGAKHYWPVHEEANRLGCCLSVHGGSYPDLGFHDLNIFAAIHAMGHPFGIMISFMSMLFNGIFDKFPNVRYGFMEGGVAWFLMALERGEGSYNAFTPLDPNRRFLQLRDGDSVRDHILRHVHEGRIFIGVEGDEPDLAHAVRTVGSDPFIWSSDFPHEVTVETCALEIRELVENEEVPDDALEAILWRNAARMYGLRTPAASTRETQAVCRRKMGAGSCELTNDRKGGRNRGERMTDWEKCPAVESVPGKLSGAWVFTGTRLPVSALFENLESGATVEEFLEWFHPVDEWKVRAVLQHAANSLKVPVLASSLEDTV